MSNERSAIASFRKHTSSLSDGRRVDMVHHRHGKNVVCSDARKWFEVEDRDNGIPFEFHKESEVRIPFFHKHKSTSNISYLAKK
jgi:hypothetical protein